MALQDVNYGNFTREEYDNNYWGLIRRIALNRNGEVVGIHDKDDTNLWDDGSEVNWTTYEEDGWNCMVQFPKFYYRTFRELHKGLDTYRAEISSTHQDGFKLHPAFIRDEAEKDFQYLSAFEGWLDSEGRMRSLPNKDVTSEKDIDTYRIAAKLNGNNFCQQEIYLTSAVQMLYLIEYGGFNAQKLLATGRTGMSTHEKTGMSLASGNNSGGDNTWMSYRGIENFYGNYRIALDGLNTHGRSMYIVTDTNFVSEKVSDNYVFTEFRAPSSGYISNFGFSHDFDYLFLPIGTEGGSNSNLSDFVDTANTASRHVALFGGYRNSGSKSGCFYLDLSRIATYSNSSMAGRIGYI